LYYHKCTRSLFKVPVVLVRFQSNVNFLGRFSKNPQIENFVKIRLLGAEFLVDRQKERHDEVNGRFSQVCECGAEVALVLRWG
jgi:hypothetical protein